MLSFCPEVQIKLASVHKNTKTGTICFGAAFELYNLIIRVYFFLLQEFIPTSC